MGKVAAIGGFLLGSAVTFALTYAFSSSKKKKGENNKFDQKRSQLSSSYVAASGVEHVSFLTGILAQLWNHINIAGSAMVKETMEPMFKDMMPGPLSTLRFTKIDLGKVPLRLDNIVVREIKNNTVQYDMDIIWDGECDIQLKADYIGSFGVKSVKLLGRMSFLLKPLTNGLPIVEAIQYAFVNLPYLELQFTGLAQVAEFDSINNSIKKVLHQSMQDMVVLPTRMLYKMNPVCSFFDIYEPPVGIARITLVKGRGFQIEKRRLGSDDVPDVYANISLGNKTWRSSTISNSLSPQWNECADFLLFDQDQKIQIHALDEDSGNLDADDELGYSQVTVGDVLLNGRSTELELLHEGDDRGSGSFVTINCDVCELTQNLNSFETQKEEGLICGLLTILVGAAFNIPLKKEEAATFVKTNYKTFEFVTGTVVDAPGCDGLNPLYDCAFHVPLTSEMIQKKDGVVKFSLINGEDDILGTTEIPHSSLVGAKDKTITERKPIGDSGATLEFRIILNGVSVELKPELHGQGKRQTQTQAQVNSVTNTQAERKSSSDNRNVRISILRGWGFKVEKKRFKKDDVPDVYCKVKFGTNSKVWRTSTIRDSIEPEFNESTHFPHKDHGQFITFDVFDEDRGNDEDDFLGSGRITVGKVLLAPGGTADVELVKQGQCTGAFLRLQCNLV